MSKKSANTKTTMKNDGGLGAKSYKRIKTETNESAEEVEDSYQVIAKKSKKLKKSKRSSFDLDIYDTNDTPNVSYSNGHNSIDQNGEINGSVKTRPEDRFAVYLIRKPVEVSLEDLRKLKFSCDDSILKKNKLKTESGTYNAVVNSEKKLGKMLHVPAMKEVVSKDAQNIKPAGFLSGCISVIPRETKDKYLGGAIYEEGEEPEPDAVCSSKLKPIKKVAKLDTISLKQRNMAYGTKTDSNHRLRKLPDILLDQHDQS
ncbi:unnamed protein product [Caenorhabditis auriculariae]|uniref:Uncharacterized protein n=1 Tax=Caenorhabditis auriculariae TaxID=2777116 RepID=A0A8S1GXX6_9PELO|nr:unnamed protein product [Caenorhabditis auriculariae]